MTSHLFESAARQTNNTESPTKVKNSFRFMGHSRKYLALRDVASIYRGQGVMVYNSIAERSSLAKVHA
jgi:hypothetical protein